MKWFALAVSFAVALSVSPAEAGLLDRFGSFFAGDEIVQGPIQAEGKIIQGPVQKDAVQADCGCGHKGLGGHAGCCQKSPSCCDGIWNGYCHQRKHRCHKRHAHGKGGCEAPCHAFHLPQFHLPKVQLPKVNVQVDWPSMCYHRRSCAPAWRRQSVPACHHHGLSGGLKWGLNGGWLNRGHGDCCDHGYGGKLYDGKVYDGPELPAVPQVDGEYDIPQPQLDAQDTAVEIQDNSAWLRTRPFLAR